MSVELVPLAQATFTLDTPIVIPDSPMGTNIIVGVSNGRYEGERLTATQIGFSSEWARAGRDGIVELDLRVVLETYDAALIFVRFRGRTDISKGPGRAPIYGAPLYETGDPRYDWLNRIQAVSKGEITHNIVRYEVFELR